MQRSMQVRALVILRAALVMQFMCLMFISCSAINKIWCFTRFLAILDYIAKCILRWIVQFNLCFLHFGNDCTRLMFDWHNYSHAIGYKFVYYVVDKYSLTKSRYQKWFKGKTINHLHADLQAHPTHYNNRFLFITKTSFDVFWCTSLIHKPLARDH